MNAIASFVLRIAYLALWVLAFVTLFEHGAAGFVSGLGTEAQNFTSLVQKKMSGKSPDATPAEQASAAAPPSAAPANTSLLQKLNEREKQLQNPLGESPELKSQPPRGAP